MSDWPTRTGHCVGEVAQSIHTTSTVITATILQRFAVHPAPAFSVPPIHFVESYLDSLFITAYSGVKKYFKKNVLQKQFLRPFAP